MPTLLASGGLLTSVSCFREKASEGTDQRIHSLVYYLLARKITMEKNKTSQSPSAAKRKDFIALADLGLSSRSLNSLKRRGISTIDQLIAWSAADLRFEIRGLGPGSVEQIEWALSQQGLSLATTTARSTYNSRHTPQTELNHLTWQHKVTGAPDTTGAQL